MTSISNDRSFKKLVLIFLFIALAAERTKATANDTDITIGFGFSEYATDEPSPSLSIEVSVMGQQQENTRVYVEVYTSDGTATAPMDYVSLNKTLTFSQETTVTTFDVFIVNDIVLEGTEQFLVLLKTLDSRVNLDPSRVPVRILDDDALFIGFLSPSYAVMEDSGIVLVDIGVTRGAIASTLNIDVQLTTHNTGSAIACIDYIPVNYTLTFSSEIVNHTFEICLTNDNIAEYNETFELQLKLLTQGTNAVLQADRNLVEVTILNDDDGVVQNTTADESPTVVNCKTKTNPTTSITTITTSSSKRATSSAALTAYTASILLLSYVLHVCYY